MAFSFGTPSSAPATGISTGFSFGAAKPATPGLSLGATSQPSSGLFGTPASAPAFGSTATPAGFGTPAFGASTPSFGPTTTPAFGTTPAPTFGTTPAPAFGTTPAPAFGTTPAPAYGTGTGLGGLNFGTTTTAAASTGFSFGNTTTTAANTSLGGLGGFGFGTSQATATQNTGFGLGGPTLTSTTSGLFGSTLGTTNATSVQSSTAAAPSLGLGGGTSLTSGLGIANTSTTAAKEQQPKQNKVPNEVITSIDSFKEFVKKQKSLSTDIMRVSIKPLHKVSKEAEEILRSVQSMVGEISRARAHSRRVRTAAARALTVAELAASNLSASELEGSAPPSYIKDLITELEQQVITFKKQMEEADKQMQMSPKLLTEQEVSAGIRRMHSALVSLASRLAAAHAAVRDQRERYARLRRHLPRADLANLANLAPLPANSLDEILKDAENSSKKSKLPGFSDVSYTSKGFFDPKNRMCSIEQLAGPSPFTYMTDTVNEKGSSWYQNQAPSVMANTSVLPTNAGSGLSSFQLQKPPKRGKQ